MKNQVSSPAARVYERSRKKSEEECRREGNKKIDFTPVKCVSLSLARPFTLKLAGNSISHNILLFDGERKLR
jgi:hypothetical protein